MACPDSPDWCLQDHIRPRLDGWRGSPGTPGQHYAICPAHGGRKASLSIRVGDRGRRIVWTCHHQPPCSEAAVRAALVRRGVPDGCLPGVKGQRTEDELAAAIIGIYATVPPGRERDLAVAIAVYGPAPTRAALAALAEHVGIGRSTAYRVTDKSHGGTNVMDTRWIAVSHGETPSPTVGHPRDASTSGFGGIRHTGVDNSVGPQGRSGPALSITPCQQCERPIIGRRADAQYCGRSCQQKAARARAAAPGGRIAARERRRAR